MSAGYIVFSTRGHFIILFDPFFFFFLFARRSLVVQTEIILLIDFSGVGTPKNWARPFFVSVILTGKQLIEKKFTPRCCRGYAMCHHRVTQRIFSLSLPVIFLLFILGGGGGETCKEPKRIGANGVETG